MDENQQNNQVRMPNLLGYDLWKARSILQKSGFRTGPVTYVENKRNEDIVLAQNIDPGRMTVRDTEIMLTVSGKSPLRLLPAIFQREDIKNNNFLKRYLWIIHSILNDINLSLDNLHDFFDPLKTNASFLEWIAQWFAVNIQPNTEQSGTYEKKIRMMIRESVSIYRWRGTALGLKKMLEILTGMKPEIIEGSVPMMEYTITDEKFMGKRILDNSIIDEQTEAYRFTVVFPVKSDYFDRETISAIHTVIRAEKPAFAGYYVLFRPKTEKRKKISGTVVDNQIGKEVIL